MVCLLFSWDPAATSFPVDHFSHRYIICIILRFCVATVFSVDYFDKKFVICVFLDCFFRGEFFLSLLNNLHHFAFLSRSGFSIYFGQCWIICIILRFWVATVSFFSVSFYSLMNSFAICVSVLHWFLFMLSFLVNVESFASFSDMDYFGVILVIVL